MWSDAAREEWLADTLASWLTRRVPPGITGRRNFRIVCADVSSVAVLQSRLDSVTESHARWFVRASSAIDAVRLRHGRPEGVPPDVCVGFVLLWSEGSAEADRNAQSLTDLPAFDVADVLGEPAAFELPGEGAVRRRCEQAADAWEESARPRAREHLVAAWNALRTTLRLAPRKSEHPLRLVDSLEAWGRYLSRADIPDDVWATWPDAERADRLFRRLGQALTELRLFAFPAWAHVLGVVTSVGTRPESVRRTGEDRWDRQLEELLLENLRWASDHGALADAIAGKRTVREQVHELVYKRGVILGTSTSASAALERFCHDGDEGAFSEVEWLFHKDPGNRRSPSMGLNGLLIARGRRQPRVDPIERLAIETEEKLGPGLSEDDRGALRHLLDTGRRAAAGRASIAAVCGELAGGDRHGEADWRAITELIAARPAHAPDETRVLAAKWMAIDQKQGTPDIEVAPTLMLGLARILARAEVPNPEESPAELVLSLLDTDRPDACVQAFPVDPGLPLAISAWMRGRVRDARSFEPEDDDDEEASESLTFRVARRVAGRDQQLGSIQLDWRARDRHWRAWTLGQAPTHRTSAWSHKGRPPAGVALLKHVHTQGAQKPAGMDELSAPWTAFVREVGVMPDGKRPGTDVLDLVAPVGAAACAWVDAWAELVERAAAGRLADTREAEIASLDREQGAAIASGDFDRVKQLYAKLIALKSMPATPALPITEVRRILQVETSLLESDSGPCRLVLSPHHPLVLRLRILSERVLADVIATLWRGAWPELAQDELESCLAQWGLPEPQHVYGIGPTPLVFDGWCAGYAVYGTLDSGRDTDAATLGARAVQGVIARYTKLHAASADRLRVRVAGDDAGEWAWALLGRGAMSAQRADVDLVTSLPGRELSAFERHALSSGDGLARFEPGPDGMTPPMRFRRVDDGTAQAAHLSLVLAERLAPFQATWGDDPEPGGDVARWDTRLLFHEPRPAAIDYRVQVGEAPDELSAAVAFAVARACNRHTPYSESYSFDPAVCGPLLRKEQERADWLVLTSRRPAYRAIQACGNVSTLLDFSSAVEGGRPVQVCVSLGEARRSDCVKGLNEACRRLLGEVDIDCESLLDRARRLAPGLALRALAAAPIALEGLLGLLLTESAVAGAGRLVLSLDQHQHLLSGGGSLADLLVLELTEGAVTVRAAEAKFTLNAATPDGDPVPKALKQVATTVGRLSRFGVAHPLAARTRAAFVRAALQQVHLWDRAKPRAELDQLARIVDGLANPAVPIRIEPADRATVHVWSWAESTKDAQQGAVFVQGRSATEARLCPRVREPTT
jgi:hypothetical protein